MLTAAALVVPLDSTAIATAAEGDATIGTVASPETDHDDASSARAEDEDPTRGSGGVGGEPTANGDTDDADAADPSSDDTDDTDDADAADPSRDDTASATDDESSTASGTTGAPGGDGMPAEPANASASKDESPGGSDEAIGPEELTGPDAATEPAAADSDTARIATDGSDPGAPADAGAQTDESVEHDAMAMTTTAEQSAQAPPVGPEPAPSSATIVRTGHALAVGNDSDNQVVQVIDVLVYDGGSVRIEQVVLIINVGSADASTGRNSAHGSADGRIDQAVAARDTGVDADQRRAAHITTGRAVAIGNATITDIEQLLELEAGGGHHVTATQLAEVDNRGVAVAVTGENAAIAGPAGSIAGGSAVVVTGDAYAIGNLSEVLIEQAVLAAATGDASIVADQQVRVLNRGIAIADSGSNLAVAGSGAAAGVASGVAVAEGNVASNRVTQVALAVAGEGAGVDVRQGSVVVNLGVAVATSGANHLGTVPAEHAAAALGTGIEELLITLVLDDPDDLRRFIDAIVAQLSLVMGDLTLLDHVLSEHVTDQEQAGGRVRLDQRVLVLDLGMASASTGDNITVSAVGDLDDDALRGRAIATITTGDAFAIGNLAITSICQRAAVNRRLTEPCPVPEPPGTGGPGSGAPIGLPVVVVTPAPVEMIVEPEPARPLDPEPEREVPVSAEQPSGTIEGEVADRIVVAVPAWPASSVRSISAVSTTPSAAQAVALPRTGIDAIWLVVVGSLLLLGGAGLVRRPHRRPVVVTDRGR